MNNFGIIIVHSSWTKVDRPIPNPVRAENRPLFHVHFDEMITRMRPATRECGRWMVHPKGMLQNVHFGGTRRQSKFVKSPQPVLTASWTPRFFDAATSDDFPKKSTRLHRRVKNRPTLPALWRGGCSNPTSRSGSSFRGSLAHHLAGKEWRG